MNIPRKLVFVNINSNGQFAPDIYCKIVAKIKTDRPQGCPTYASWGVCSICSVESVSQMHGATYVMVDPSCAHPKGLHPRTYLSLVFVRASNSFQTLFKMA